MENNKTLLIQDKETINKILASLYTDANFNLKFQNAVIDGVMKRAPKIVNRTNDFKQFIDDLTYSLKNRISEELFENAWRKDGIKEKYKQLLEAETQKIIAEVAKDFQNKMDMTCLAIKNRLNEISNEVKDAFKMNGHTINAENIIRQAVFDYMDSKFGNKKLD